MKKIIIVDYNPEWPGYYEKESEKICDVLNGMEFEMEHIGSTSVKGLGAKPVIDILLGLKDFDRDNEELVSRMTEAGYNYKDDFEYTMPYRRYFNRHTDGDVTGYHIHSVQIGEWFWNRHIAFQELSTRT